MKFSFIEICDCIFLLFFIFKRLKHDILGPHSILTSLSIIMRFHVSDQRSFKYYGLDMLQFFKRQKYNKTFRKECSIPFKIYMSFVIHVHTFTYKIHI